jgi:hypothetical protein
VHDGDVEPVRRHHGADDDPSGNGALIVTNVVTNGLAEVV